MQVSLKNLATYHTLKKHPNTVDITVHNFRLKKHTDKFIFRLWITIFLSTKTVDKSVDFFQGYCSEAAYANVNPHPY